MNRRLNVVLMIFMAVAITFQSLSLLNTGMNSAQDFTFVAPTQQRVSNYPSSNYLSSNYPLPRLNATSPLLIMVLTRNDAFQRRKVIRQTYAKGCDYVYFVIGEICPIPPQLRGKDEGGNNLCTVAKQVLDQNYSKKLLDYKISTIQPNHQWILEEQETHRDLVVMNMVDVYRSLPQKIKTMYAFVDQYTTSSWILKADDDFFVRPQKLFDYIVNESQWDAKVPMVVTGNVASWAPARAGKWKEVVQYPPGQKYPPFPLGSTGHIVSRPVAEYVAKYRNVLFDYQGEDVSLGIWLGAGKYPNIPYPPVGMEGMEVEFLKVDFMGNSGNCQMNNMFVLGHDFTNERIKYCTEFWANST